MCWNIFFIFVFWRILRAIGGLFTHLLLLLPIGMIHLHRFASRQPLVAHQTRDVRADSSLGIVLLILSTTLVLCSPVSTLNLLGLTGGITIFALLVTATFRPLALLPTQNIATRSLQHTAQVYVVLLNTQQTWSKHQAQMLIEHLLQANPDIIFQIAADAAAIYWRIIDPTQRAPAATIIGILQAIYPECHVSTHPLSDWPYNRQIHRRILFFEHEQSFALPLRGLGDSTDPDVLAHLAQLSNDLQPGERLTLSLALSGRAWAARTEGYRQVTRARIPWWVALSRRGALTYLQQLWLGDDREFREREFVTRLLDHKLRSEMHYATIWVQVQSTNNQRLSVLASLAQSYLTSLSRAPFNALRLQSQLDTQDNLLHSRDLYQAWRTGHNSYLPPTLILSTDEIAQLWHLPHEQLVASRIQRIKPILPMPELVAWQREGVVAGVARYHHQWQNLHLPLEDRRHHVMVTGQTGTGKSTTLYHQIAGDISSGAGVAVVDPHGYLVRQIMMTAIPTEREVDVVWIDLSDSQYPPPLNPFGNHRPGDSTQGVITLIEQLFAGTEQAVQTANFLRAGLKLLSQQDNITMQDLAYLFLDLNYLQRLLSKTSDPEVRLFLDKQYARMSGRQRAQIALPILNRVRVFYGNDHIRPIICHPMSLDFTALMEQKKIVLISLDVDSRLLPPQERNLLGTLLVSALQLSGMQRTIREPFFIYIDEVQHFITTALSTVFSEARKYGLIMTTANQYLSQIQGASGDAMLGNAGTTITFRAGPDSRILADRTKPQADEQHLRNLDAYTAVVKSQVNKSVQPAFTMRTKALPALPMDAQQRFERIRNLSRQQYTPHTREYVEQVLQTRYAESINWHEFNTFD